MCLHEFYQSSNYQRHRFFISPLLIKQYFSYIYIFNIYINNYKLFINIIFIINSFFNVLSIQSTNCPKVGFPLT